MSTIRYWLVKSEPECFSIDHLAAAPKQTTYWSGVRNYQARNMLRDEMKPGDRVLYYHSNAEPPAVVGLATVVRPGYPDHTAENKSDDHYDPKHTKSNPIWYMVDIRFDEKFPRDLALDELRGVSALKDMELLKRGSRLSVQPVRKTEFDAIVKLAHQKVGKKST
jgi:predicted RNA-binding protein with PUA-like domain